MRGINKAIIVGQIVSKINYRKTPKGTSVCSFKLRTSYKRSDGTYKNDEFNIEVWEKLADVCNDNLSQNRIVYVEGRIESPKTDKENEKQKFKIVCNVVEFLDEKPKMNNVNIIDQII